MTKLSELSNQYGYDDPSDMLEEVGLDSVVPAICMNPECDYTTDMEPDQSRGWCEVCDTNTVKSALVLMGVI